MSDVIRKTPYVSPDTLRAKLHMDQKLFNAHTSNTAFHEHSNQTYNVSHIENWGAEMLLETRKMKMNRPPLGDIHLNPRFEEYFELRYDDNINTYEQENAIMCLLKANTLQDGKKLYVTFENVTQMILPRAASDSERKMFPHVVWKTNTPPKLHIETNPGSGVYDLIASSEGDKLGQVTYWFCTTSTATTSGNNAVDFYARNLLDEEYCQGTTIQTLPIEVWGEGLPLVWLTFENLNHLPKIALENNIGYNNHPIFTFGTDGNNNHYIYPFMWGNDNYPEERIPEDSDWQVRLHPRTPFDMESTKLNVDCYITEIEFVHYKNNDPYTPENHLGSFKVLLPTKNARFKFVTNEEVYYPYSKWNFNHWYYRKAVEGDWDYDGTTYNNPVYAYLNNGFVQMQTTSSATLGAYTQPFLKVIPNTTYNPLEYRWTKDNVAIGMHVDYTTDYSLNHVTKKHGTIFNLGDFDGLPPYYYYKLPRNTHRAHVELYAVKDVPNGPTNHAMDKRVAAIFVDAGIPQTEISNISDDMKSGIMYDITAESPTYITKEENILSTVNVKSDIGYYSRDKFCDITIEKYAECKPFVYHGARTFSLGSLGYDPELEYGRVYYLSNDSIEYNNNAVSSLKKPPRTMARICDIPTDTSQLISIKGKSPTLVLDEKYQRTELNYSFDDFMKLWDSRTLVKDGNTVFFREESPYYNIEHKYDSKFDYIYTLIQSNDSSLRKLASGTRIGFTLDQIFDTLYTNFWEPAMIDLYEGNTHVCHMALTMKDSSNKITNVAMYAWYVDTTEQKSWHIDKIYYSAHVDAGVKKDGTIENFKMSLYLIDQLDYSDWETIGIDLTRNPLDYQLTYQWINQHYGIPKNLEYCATHTLHLCKEIEAEIAVSTFNDDGYLWQIRQRGTGYMIGDVIQCYMGGRVCRGVVTQISSGRVSKISMLNPDDPEYDDVSFTNFDKTQTVSTTLIQKQYGSAGSGLELKFTIKDSLWSDAYSIETPGYANMNRLLALQFDAYDNLWAVTPSVIKTTSQMYIPNGDITVTENDTDIMYTVIWSKVYQITGEHIDMNAYNYYSLNDFYKYTLNAIMMFSLFDRIVSSSMNQEGCIYSAHVYNHTSILTLPQDYGDAYDSLTQYLCDNMFANGLLHEDSYYVLKTGTQSNEDVYNVNWYECSDIWGYLHDAIPFPRNHKAIVKPGMRKSGRLLFQEGNLPGVSYYDNHPITKLHQSAVFVYSSEASSFPVYQKYYHGMTQRISDHPFLFTDFDEYGYYHSEKSIYELKDGNVKLKYDVFKYNGDHVEKPSEEIIMEEYLEEAYEAYKASHPAWEDESDEEYLTRLEEGWTKKVQREWLYKVAGQKGKDILYSPSVNDVNQSMTLLRGKGEVVGTDFDDDNHTYTPVGDQPTGLSIPLTTRVYQKQYHFNTSPTTTVETDLQFFFKIPDEVETLQGFRMKSVDGDDISKYTMLLYKNKLYVFDDRNEDDIKWISLQRRNNT